MAPSKVKVTEGTFKNERGQALFILDVLPPPGAAKCAVVWHPGLFEHCRRKLPVFEDWAARGIAVFALDPHGMGASEPAAPGERFLVQSMGHLIDDMADVAAYAQRRHPALAPLPWFASGYSIGGLTAALMVLRHQSAWAGLALYAPCVGVHMTVTTRIQKFFGPCLDCLAPRAKICHAVDPEDLNPDPAAIAAYKADPLNGSGSTRVRSAFQFSKGMAVIEQSAPQLRVPVYCEHNKGDAVARWEESREFCASVGSEDVTWVPQEGGCHDGMSSADAPKIAARMADWMLAKSAAIAKGKPTSPSKAAKPQAK